MEYSKQAFALRKSGDLDGALKAAIEAMKSDPHEEWNQRAMAWVLHDHIKKALADGDLTVARNYYAEIRKLTMVSRDEILAKQMSVFEKKLSGEANLLEEASALITSEAYEDALSKFRIAIQQLRENLDVNEQYGWCIYKLLKLKWAELTSIEKKKLLQEYLGLHNQRPSLLHSMILQHAMKLADEGELKLYEFFKLWNPKRHRAEDTMPTKDGEKEYPSLIDRILRKIFDSDADFSVDWLAVHIKLPILGFDEDHDDRIYLKWSEVTYWRLWNDFKEDKWNDFQYATTRYFDQLPKASGEFHSKILEILIKASEEGAPVQVESYILNWDYTSFRHLDYRPKKLEEGEIPCLAERAALKVAKMVLESSHSTIEQLERMRQWLNYLLNQLPFSLMSRYYLGKVLLRQRNTDGALKELLLFVVGKSREYWAWSALAEAYEPISEEKAIACYCKALSFKNDEIFVSKLRIALASLLAKASRHTEAITEVVQYLNFKTKAGARISEDAEILSKAAWFDRSKGGKHNRALYHAQADLAEELLFENLPWVDGVVAGRYSHPEKGEMAKVMWNEKGVLQEMGIRLKNFKHLQDAEIGAPVTLKVEKAELTHGKPGFEKIKLAALGKGLQYSVRMARLRKGEFWNIVPKQVGVVDHVNHEKLIAHFIVSRTMDGIIRFHPESAPIEGDFVQVRLIPKTKEGKKWFDLIDWHYTEERPEESLFRSFRGEVTIREGNSFGFVDSFADIFIPQEIVRAFALQDGMVVSGNAVLNYNKRNGTWGWKAINLEVVSDGRQSLAKLYDKYIQKYFEAEQSWNAKTQIDGSGADWYDVNEPPATLEQFCEGIIPAILDAEGNVEREF